jgi:hypothetical protein
MPSRLEAYLDDLTHPLPTAEQRAEWRMEAEQHLAVMIAAYEELGHDHKTAVELALAAFGEAQQIGQRMQRECYRPFWQRPEGRRFVRGAVGASVGAVFCPLFLLGASEGLACNFLGTLDNSLMALSLFGGLLGVSSAVQTRWSRASLGMGVSAVTTVLLDRGITHLLSPFGDRVSFLFFFLGGYQPDVRFFPLSGSLQMNCLAWLLLVSMVMGGLLWSKRCRVGLSALWMGATMLGVCMMVYPMFFFGSPVTDNPVIAKELPPLTALAALSAITKGALSGALIALAGKAHERLQQQRSHTDESPAHLYAGAV